MTHICASMNATNCNGGLHLFGYDVPELMVLAFIGGVFGGLLGWFLVMLERGGDVDP